MIAATRDHYTRNPIVRLESRRAKLVVEHKPEGLWYGVNGDWKRWVDGEELDWLDGKIRHAVQLDLSRILQIRDEVDLLIFSRDFLAPPRHKYDASIDWPMVAEEWAGVEIAPYVGSLRLDSRVRWYYGWDAARGCVWDPEDASVQISEVPA